MLFRSTLQLPGEDSRELNDSVAHARRLAAEIEARHPGTTVHLTGVSMLNNAFAESGQKDAMTLFPVMFAVLVAIMLIITRSASATGAVLVVIGVSAATAFGLAGYAGVQFLGGSLVEGAEHVGELQAWNLATGERVWTQEFGEFANWGPILTTAGGLVFQGGTADRYFRAFDAESGDRKSTRLNSSHSSVSRMPSSA